MSAKSSSFWTLAVLASIFLHTLLWIWAPQNIIRPPKHRLSPGHTEVFLLPPQNDATRWSSAIFSLPTPLGFSGRLWQNENASRPPGPEKWEYTPHLEKPSDYVVTNAAVFAWTRKPSDSSLGIPVVFEKNAVSSVDTNAYLSVQWGGDFYDKGTQRIRVHEDDAWFDAKAWDTKTHLVADGRGAVQHVFLEKSTGSGERDEKLVQWLKRWHMPARQRNQDGWAVVRFSAGVAREAAHD